MEDDAATADALVRVLRTLRPGWTVSLGATAERGRALLERGGADVVIADIDLSGSVRGTEFLRHLARLHPRILRVILSGVIDRNALVETAKWAQIHLCKPCPATVLVARLERHFAAREEGDPPGSA